MRSILAFAAASVAALALSAALAAHAQGRKTIKDPAEYNAYIAALNTADPAAKALAMEGFLKAYPASIMHEDALEQAMAAYQATGDVAHVEDAARRILAIDPDSVRALAIIAFLERRSAGAESSPQQALALADQAGVDAEHGMKALQGWSKPDGVSDADYATLRGQMTSIFAGALGFHALQHKDYAAARGYYATALAANPGDLQNAFQLAIRDLQSDPVDPAGFWWGAHAFNLAAGNAAGQKSIQDYVQAHYRRYHGSDDGWQAVVSQAAAGASAPPAAFSVKPAPTPAELAVQAVAQYDPANLSFSDWSFILSHRDASAANKDAADKVWAAIMAKQGSARMKLAAKVIAYTADGLDVAVSDDAQKGETGDMHVVLAAPLAAPPARGAMVNVVGVLTSYTPNPFSFRMEKGSIEP
jgi:hypothetical protein